MSVSLKGLCLVILVWVKEGSKFPCGNLIFWVQTLMSRFGITTVFIDTVTLFFTWLDIKSWFVPSRICIYFIANKITRCQLISIWLNIFLDYIWDICKAKNVKIISALSLTAIEPYPFTWTSYSLLFEIPEILNAWILSKSNWGFMLSNNFMIVQ